MNEITVDKVNALESLKYLSHNYLDNKWLQGDLSLIGCSNCQRLET